MTIENQKYHYKLSFRISIFVRVLVGISGIWMIAYTIMPVYTKLRGILNVTGAGILGVVLIIISLKWLMNPVIELNQDYVILHKPFQLKRKKIHWSDIREMRVYFLLFFPGFNRLMITFEQDGEIKRIILLYIKQVIDWPRLKESLELFAKKYNFNAKIT